MRRSVGCLPLLGASAWQFGSVGVFLRDSSFCVGIPVLGRSRLDRNAHSRINVLMR